MFASRRQFIIGSTASTAGVVLQSFPKPLGKITIEYGMIIYADLTPDGFKLRDASAVGPTGPIGPLSGYLGITILHEIALVELQRLLNKSGGGVKIEAWPNEWLPRLNSRLRTV
jgi:hypothetical protein